MTPTSSNNQLRNGFTLVELLVVVGIIAFLASLSIVVLLNITDSSREQATVSTVVKVGRLLDDRVSAFNRSMRGTRLKRAGELLERNAKVAMLPAVYGARPFASVPVEPHLLDPKVAEAIARKVEFRNSFPQRFSELADTANVLEGTAGSNGIPDVVEQKAQAELLEAARQRLINGGNPSPTPAQIAAEAVAGFAGHTDESESSELLYFSLTKLAVFGAAPIAADSFVAGEIADTDGDGLSEFVDSWGNPLRFYRWPTRLIDPDYDATLLDHENVVTDAERQDAELLIRSLPGRPPIEPASSPPTPMSRDPLKIDPDDPIGRIGFELARLDGSRGPDLSLYFNEAEFHSPDVYHLPLIVSAGPDGELGLREPNDVDAPMGIFGNLAQFDPSVTIGRLSDNITNRNRRAGGN